MNDIVINKIQSIQRCVQRVREGYQRMDLGVVTAVITSGLDELIEFGDRALFFLGENQP